MFLSKSRNFGGVFKVFKRNYAEVIKVAENDGVRRITMVDEKTRNSMSMDMSEQLLQAVTHQVEEPSLRAIVISSGGSIFSSGHNLKDLSRSDGRKVFKVFSDFMVAIQTCPVPVITVIDGIAAAAGCQLVAQSDIAIASKKSTFSTPGANFGVFCHTPGIPLARNVPKKTAAYMLFTGIPLTAQEALERGLVSKIAESSDLDREVDIVCDAIKHKSKVIVSYGKKFFYRQIEMDIRSAYSNGTEAMNDSLDFEDGIEGLRSFSEKRKPIWKHVNHK